MKYAKVTKRPLGYAFVELFSYEDALLCKNKLHASIIHGQAIAIGWAVRNSKLFIGDIDETITMDDLLGICTPYGPVKREGSSLKRTEAGLLYGVIDFVDREDADTARSCLNGSELKSNTIYVNWEQSSFRSNTQDDTAPNTLYPFFSIHVSFNSPHVIIVFKLINIYLL